MGQFYQSNWKTNNYDIVQLANACASLVKHPDRSDDELILVAEISDKLFCREDLSADQYKQFIRAYKGRTGKTFFGSASGCFVHPRQRGVHKGINFAKVLTEHGIDLNEFDPDNDWKDEPVLGLRGEELLQALHVGRGAKRGPPKRTQSL